MVKPRLAAKGLHPTLRSRAGGAEVEGGDEGAAIEGEAGGAAAAGHDLGVKDFGQAQEQRAVDEAQAQRVAGGDLLNPDLAQRMAAQLGGEAVGGNGEDGGGLGLRCGGAEVGRAEEASARNRRQRGEINRAGVGGLPEGPGEPLPGPERRWTTQTEENSCGEANQKKRAARHGHERAAGGL